MSKKNPPPALGKVFDLPTATLESKYKVFKRLGAGAFGCVHLVKDSRDHPFACKSIKINSKNQRIEIIQREVGILRHLNGGPNIVHLHELIEDKSHLYIIMELCNGGPLKMQGNQSSASRKRKRRLSKENEVKHLFWQIVLGVNYCHQLGVLHGDLKMDNILFLEDTKKTLKIVDFGVAKFCNPGEYVQERGAGAGDLSCIAPEVAKNVPYGPKADIWSAGVILYSLLSGVRPYEVEGSSGNDTLRAIRYSNHNNYNTSRWDKISKEGKDLVSRMLKEDPVDRISLAEVLDHKWFKDAGSIASDPTAIESPIISRMRSFKTMTIFKRSILKMIAETVVLDNECLGLRKVFNSLSTFCKKNEISFDNMKTGLRRFGKHDSEGMDLLLDAMDLDGNKRIHRTEFVAATMRLNPIERADCLEKTFQKFPLDIDRSITKDGLKQTLLEINICSLKIEDIIAEIYVDEDRKISLADFQALLQ